MTPTSIFLLFLEVSLKGTLFLVIAAAGAFATRRAAASLRHSMWSFSLVAMLAIPLLSLVLPEWQLGLLPALLPNSGVVASKAESSPSSLFEQTTARGSLDELAYRASSRAKAVGPVVKALPSGLVASNIPTGESRSILDTLALLWLGGVAAGLITVCGGMFALKRLAWSADRLESGEWRNVMEELTALLGIRRNVRLLRSRSAAMPATWGVFWPVVLLPSEADEWTEERKRVVLLHELAHVSRNDCLMQFLAQLVCAVYWFHPGVWYMGRRLRAERELACDEHVLGIGINACDYATHLLEIASGFRSPAGTSLSAVAMARPSQLEGRLHAILSEDLVGRVRASGKMKLGASLVLTALVLPLAAMRPWREPASALAVPIASPPASTIAAASDTFRWKAPVPQGQWVEVISMYGDIRAELSRDDQVEILAVRKNGASGSFAVAIDKAKGSTVFCTIAASSAGAAKPCEMETFGRLKHGLADVRVDYLIKVPAGVGVSAHTGRGNIAAEGVRSYVWGTSDRGDISITTTGLAEASTRIGSISAQFGSRKWKQNLEFFTEQGDVTVYAPSNATMMIEAETSLGHVRSEFGGAVKPFGSGQHIITRMAKGGSMLTMRTGRGAVDFKRGGVASEEVSNMPIESSDAPESYVDPKPNPQPDPASNPNPNPNVDPGYNSDPNLNPDVESSDTGDPTGERVPVKLPAGFIGRFSDSAIRGWADAAAIAGLRDIAVSHVKQHPADLVKERSEWALTLVRNGQVIVPLKAALSSSDRRHQRDFFAGSGRDA